ncbi:GFA family protein [Roseomonas terrae]|uniref:GFA family protein n=1 Tax=Neoroseomonas terrae TaxID=424799 RepID=A0ABS5ECJ2_9PROT|nr:GFA family protein [Neoroseomonas terrae]
MLKGGCFCGYVRYEAGGTPFHSTVCHCSMCRRVAGAPMVAWFSVPRAEYRVVAGEPTRFASSPQAFRTFCPRCGTPLTFESAYSPDEIDITTVSLDDPETMPPADHTRTATQLSWVHLDDGLPTYPELRPED